TTLTTTLTTSTAFSLSTLAVMTALLFAGPAACDLETPPASDESPCVDAEAVQSVPGTFVHDLHSEIVGEDFRISVALPQGFIPGMEPPEGGAFPVIYVLDGYWAFGGAAELARSQAPYSIPHAIVVGIAYEDTSAWGRLLRRTRDFTPTAWDLYAEVNDRDLENRLAQGDSAPFDHYPMGGAEAFLGFLQDELKPMIEASYPVDASDATIVGSSFGGLFASYVLLNEPSAFQRYVIVSPGLNWDDGLLMDHERAYAETHDDLQAKVFFAAGGREREERLFKAQYGDALTAELEESYRMVERIETLVGALESRGYPGLEVHHKVIEGENHTSVGLPASSIGLRAVFGSQYFFSL
ncbi:MAG: alpha/beta hydrolase, partial [Myxococcales bacterium]|nr:alpha/beta hydrolase [Myxococcales bacterium]